MSNLHKFQPQFILLAEAGFIAVNQGDEDAALKLFKAAELLEPKNPLPRLGLGYMHFCKLELKQAVSIFDKILEEDPQNEMAQTLKGLSLALNPSEITKGEKVLEETAKHAQSPEVQNLAKTALEFVERFVKKSPSPAQVQSSSKSPKKKGR